MGGVLLIFGENVHYFLFYSYYISFIDLSRLLLNERLPC